MTGYDNGMFGPEDALLREQEAAVLSRVLGDGRVHPATTLRDVVQDSWYADSVNWAVDTGTMVGYGNTGLFGVGEPLTREQLAVVMARVCGADVRAADASRFEALPGHGSTSPWARESVAWAVSAGVINGVGQADSTRLLDPQGTVTRAQMAAVMMNATRAGLLGGKADTYRVCFVSEENGTTRTISDNTYKLGDRVAEPADPTWAGHVFLGWDPTPSATCEGEATYRARWYEVPKAPSTVTPSTPTVSFYGVFFDANGGSGSRDAMLGMVGSDVTLPSSRSGFSRDGYLSTGWNTRADGTGTHYDDFAQARDLVAGGSTVTLYVEWAPAYTITYVSRSEAGDILHESSDAAVVGSEVTLRSQFPDRWLYKLVGWNTEAGGTGAGYSLGQKVTLSAKQGETVTLYAQWVDNSYTIEYHGNYGDSDNTWSETQEVGGTVWPGSQSRYGYLFDGWDTEPDGTGTRYQADVAVTIDAQVGDTVELFAQWKLNSYTIAYYLNREDESEGVFETQMAVLGEDVTLYSQDGGGGNAFTFLSWNTKADGTGTAYEGHEVVRDLAGVGETVSLYAQWQDDRQVICFDANGGTGTMEPITEWGIFTIPWDTTFTRPGYRFTGWNTRADGTGDPQTGSFNMDIDGKWWYTDDEGRPAVKLYAQWVRQYAFHFDGNGATIAGSGGQEKTGLWVFDEGYEGILGDQNIALADYMNENLLLGWSVNKDGSGKIYAAGTSLADVISDCADAMTVSGEEYELTLYAQWKPYYTVIFDGDGGTWDDGKTTVSKAFAVDSDFISGYNEYFARRGYNAVGWARTPGQTTADIPFERYYQDFAKAGDVVRLYQVWNPVYGVTFMGNGGTQENGASRTYVSFSGDGSDWLSYDEGFTNGSKYFRGWNTKADGTGTSCLSVADFPVESLTEENLITLYAQWSD